MERGALEASELTDKTVYDPDGARIGVIRRVSTDPDRRVASFGVEVEDPGHLQVAEVGPYVELMPDSIDHVGPGEVHLTARVAELVPEEADQAHRLETPPGSPIAIELVGEPPVDPDWDDD